MEQIRGGYIMIARKIDESKVSEAPPYTREIWFYLLRTANHHTTHICKRGQTIRRYTDIIDALKWYVGYRKCTYTTHQCENAMKYLTKANMITKTRTTRGLLITICNYDTYQNSSHYENQSHTPDTSATMEPQGRQTINKNDKNDKNDKKLHRVSKCFIPPLLEEVVQYVTKENYNVDPKTFFDYYTVSNWVDSKGKPVKNWKQRIVTWASRANERGGKINTETAKQRRERIEKDGIAC